MSRRLDQDREAKLQPKRMDTAMQILHEYNPTQVDDVKLQFVFKDNVITYFPYSGWHTGKGINDGRGLVNLLKQLKQ